MHKVVGNLGTMLMLVLVPLLGGLLLPARTASAANITVNTTVDEVNTNTKCSLREAIRAANTNTAVGACPAGSSSGTDTITLAASTYPLTRAGANENGASTGDLDITSAVKIIGKGALTKINGNDLDRVFDVRGTGNLTLVSLTVQNGTAPSSVPNTSHSVNGGGIYNGGTLTLDRVTVTDNYTQGYGGGIYTAASKVTKVTLSTISLNAAVVGGGIFNDGSTNSFSSTVRSNSSSSSGGGIYNTGTMNFNKGAIYNNRSTGSFGGGIRNVGTLLVFNSTVSGNTAAADGGGIDNSGTLTLSVSTIARNTGSVGGVWGSATLANTIIAENNGSEYTDCNGPLTSQGYNIVGTYSPSAGTYGNCSITTSTGDLLDYWPDLQVLANYGGPTVTHAIPNYSWAVDNGNPNPPAEAAFPRCPIKDQRDMPRPQDGNGDAFDRCDIGSYELQVAAAAASESLVSPEGAVGTEPEAETPPTPPAALPGTPLDTKPQQTP